MINSSSPKTAWSTRSMCWEQRFTCKEKMGGIITCPIDLHVDRGDASQAGSGTDLEGCGHA